MKTAVITDTNSGIYPDEARKMGIWSIRMPIVVNGVTRYEGEDLLPDEFFQLQKSGAIITTSQPAPSEITGLWDEVLAQGYDEIVYIPMTSGLSHSCETAIMLSANYGGRVCVADNHRISVLSRIAVMEAKAMADQGLPAQYIASALELNGHEASVYITVDNLEYLKRGGRITPAAAALGSMLKIKPVLSIQGGLLEAHSKERGLNKAVNTMFKALHKDIKNRFGGADGKYVVASAGTKLSDETKMAILTRLKEEFPGHDVYYDDLPLSIATHTGPGAIGVGVISNTVAEISNEGAVFKK